ncbi:reverse transcriptase [Hirsutella rhossiliensis]
MVGNKTESKFSLPVIHSIYHDPTNLQLLHILKQKTTDLDVKRYAVQYMEETSGFKYTRGAVYETQTEKADALRAEILERRAAADDIPWAPEVRAPHRAVNCSVTLADAAHACTSTGNTSARLAKEGCRAEGPDRSPTYANIKRQAKAAARRDFQDWWAAGAPSSYKSLELKASLGCPPELHTKREHLHHLLAARSGHGDFADYHERFNHEEARIECSCGGENHRHTPTAGSGSIAFVDDYSAWVTGPTAESNRDVDKTSVIHFTRIAERDSDSPFAIRGNDVKPKDNVKLLGVIMDQALRFKEHIAGMASPRTARQLFTATVAPTMDYASNAITGGFRTVATAVAEAEAGVQSFRERHAQAAAKFWIRMRTLPKTHPLTSLRLKLHRRYASPMQKLASAMSRLDTKRVEVIHEFALAPWDERMQAKYEADRVEVMRPEVPEDITIATSSSQRKGKVGLGGVVRDASRDNADEVLASYSVTLGSSDEQNVYTAGLEAIAMALSNRAVLQVIGRPRQQSGKSNDVTTAAQRTHSR